METINIWNVADSDIANFWNVSTDFSKFLKPADAKSRWMVSVNINIVTPFTGNLIAFIAKNDLVNETRYGANQIVNPIANYCLNLNAIIEMSPRDWIRPYVFQNGGNIFIGDPLLAYNCMINILEL